MNIFLPYTYIALLALSSFAFVSSITPGPNNLMLLYSGARFGFNRTIPHLLGVSLGFGIMLLLCCLGIAALLLELPMAQVVLKVLGCAYMLWLALKLWQNGALPTSNALDQTEQADRAKPMTFMQAAMFQYVNPKAWMMGLTVPSSYLPHSDNIIKSAVIATLIFTVINLFCVGLWVQGGVVLRQLMHRPLLAKIINLTIVAMTVYCAIAVWIPNHSS